MLARCQKFPEKCNTKKKAVILNCFCICEEQLGWNLIKTKQKQLSEPKGYFLAVFKRLLKKKSYSLTLFFFNVKTASFALKEVTIPQTNQNQNYFCR